MQSHIFTATAFAVSAAFAFGSSAMSADLPQQGSFTTHSAGKFTFGNPNGQPVQVGEKHFIASGTAWHVLSNDAGNGPLHRGSGVCTFAGDDVNGSYTVSGDCAFGDAGGADKIFVGWSGKGTENVGEQGTGTITGGIGKYDGIQGKFAYQCKPIDPAQGLFDCTQRFDYQLAAAATR